MTAPAFPGPTGTRSGAVSTNRPSRRAYTRTTLSNPPTYSAEPSGANAADAVGAAGPSGASRRTGVRAGGGSGPSCAAAEGTAGAIAREAQIRLWWDDAPIDLFFDYVPIHADAKRNRKTVPFEGTRIPVLGPTELAAFKVMFDRTRDWADIEAMLAAGTLDVQAVRSTLRTLLEPDDHRFARLDQAVRAAGSS